MLTSRLLILNDKETKCLEMAEYFQESGYMVVWCTEHDEALDILRKGKQKIDLLLYVADDSDSAQYRLIDQIREFSDICIILVSGDEKLDSQLYAYSKKIDDYIVNPAPLPLLEAHVEALIRRAGGKRVSMEKVGDLSIDYEARKLYLAGRPVRVTAKEFDLMEYFVRHKGMVLTRDKLLDAVWGYDYIGGYRSVDTLVKKLRAKLTGDHPYIKTIYGVGYCFDTQERSKKNEEQ